MIAKEMKGHTIVVGYAHLGERIVNDLRQRGEPYVLIEKDATAVDDLVREGEPVIVDNAKEDSTLEEAGIAVAKRVLIVSNNIETALLVTKKAREKNKTATIVVRCFQDDFVEILESLGATEVISSSKSAMKELQDSIDKVTKPE